MINIIIIIITKNTHIIYTIQTCNLDQSNLTPISTHKIHQIIKLNPNTIKETLPIYPLFHPSGPLNPPCKNSIYIVILYIIYIFNSENSPKNKALTVVSNTSILPNNHHSKFIRIIIIINNNN